MCAAVRQRLCCMIFENIVPDGRLRFLVTMSPKTVPHRRPRPPWNAQSRDGCAARWRQLHRIHDFFRASASRTVQLSSRTEFAIFRSQNNRTLPYRGCFQLALESVECEPNRTGRKMYGTAQYGTDSPLCPGSISGHTWSERAICMSSTSILSFLLISQARSQGFNEL